MKDRQRDLFPAVDSGVPAAQAKPKSDLQRAIDAFDLAYRAAYTMPPSWGAKNCAMMKRLVASHGADEVIVRIERLFDGALKWPEPPYNLGILVTQFDRLVVVVSRRPSDLLRGGGKK